MESNWRKWNRIKKSGRLISRFFNHTDGTIDWEGMGSRVRNIVNLFSELQESTIDMTPYLITYDISDNRLRTHLMKYLMSKGMKRVQLSVYIGKASGKIINKMQRTLGEMCEIMGKDDSILIMPINQDVSKRMEFYGKNVRLDLDTKTKHTIFI